MVCLEKHILQFYDIKFMLPSHKIKFIQKISRVFFKKSSTIFIPTIKNIEFIHISQE